MWLAWSMARKSWPSLSLYYSDTLLRQCTAAQCRQRRGKGGARGSHALVQWRLFRSKWTAFGSSQGRRKVWKSRVGASIDVVGIICSPWLYRVKWTVKIWGHPPATPATPAPTGLLWNDRRHVPEVRGSPWQAAGSALVVRMADLI